MVCIKIQKTTFLQKFKQPTQKNKTLFYRGQSKLSDDVISPSTPPDTWKNFIGACALSSSNEPEEKKKKRNQHRNNNC